MLSFGVSNLRRLKLVPPIELKPITILVGRNSSGKSSFLRAFPLLRQSLMTRTSSPILWYGDLVDFGSFDVSVSDNAVDEPISFSFVIDELHIDDPRPVYYPNARRPRQQHTYRGVHVDVSIVGSGDRTRISRLFVRADQPRISYDVLIGDNSRVSAIVLDGQEVSGLLSPIKLQISPGTLLPEMTVVRADEKKGRSTSQRMIFSELGYYYIANEFVEPIKMLLKPYLKKLKESWAETFATELLIAGSISKEKIRQEFGSIGPQAWRKLVIDICGPDRRGIYPKLRDMLTLAALPPLLSQVRSHLRAVISSTLYIGPARARSERYYRYQDLAVSEIDPDGKNFPMFLNSLTPFQIAQLSRWIEELFGYGLSVSRQSGGGHMSINLVTRGVTSNIVDTGYGVSQILPVLGQIWWARTRLQQSVENPSLSLLAIEQPELHLHPAHQALLADALVGELSGGTNVTTASQRIHFLIETHSETLLNRLGELIAAGRISHNDIQVVLFEALDDDTRLTDVRTSSFGHTGELINWPYGFFQPIAK